MRGSMRLPARPAARPGPRPTSLLALVVAASACTDLPIIEVGVCGNRVLEAGEDCDGPIPRPEALCGAPTSANACRFTCEDGASCPSGWRCGLDRRCRRPAERLATPERALALVADRVRLADVDGDGALDVVGHTATSLSVRYGDGAGQLDTLRVLGIPRAIGAVAVRDLDLDGRDDVVVPVDEGLFVLRGRRDRSLAPVAATPFVLPADAGATVVPLEADPAAPGREVVLLHGPSMGVIDLGPEVALPAPGKTSADLLGRIPVTRLPGAVRDAFALPMQGAEVVWVITASGAASRADLRPVVVQTVRLPGVLDRGLRFADVNGDGFTDLVAAIRMSDGPRLAVAYWSFSTGRFADACLLGLRLADGSELTGPLAWADLDGDAVADPITSRGVGLSPIEDRQATCGAVTASAPIAADNRRGRWSEAVVADVNGDGRPDVVAAQARFPELDVLLSDGRGGFNPSTVATGGLAVRLVAADFDGDFVDDVAFVRQGGEVDEDEIAVAFGARGARLGAPISMGRLGRVVQLEGTLEARGGAAADRVADLLVTSEPFPDGGPRRASVLLGSAERRLVAPLAVAELGGLARTPLAVVVGDLCRECAVEPCEDAPDLAAVALGLGEAGNEPGLWIVPGAPGAMSTGFGAAAAPDPLPALADFDVACARWLAADLDGDGRAEVIGVDGATSCPDTGAAASRLLRVRRPLADRRCAGPVDLDRSALPTSLVRLLEARVADADGDGDLDLLLAFEGRAQRDEEGRLRRDGAGAAVVWNEGGRLGPDSMTTLATQAAVVGVAPLRLDADDRPELVLLVRRGEGEVVEADGLYLARLAEDLKSYDVPRRIARAPGAVSLAVGDVDGDGLEDVVWGDGELIRVAPAVAQEQP